MLKNMETNNKIPYHRSDKLKLNEGIDISYKTRTISYNPTHEKNVETSLDTNPSIDRTIIDGINVWSIFKRKNSSAGDGNPLIHALKNELGWKFRSYSDELAIRVRFKEIAKKFSEIYPIEVTILVPSTNILNQKIANAVMSYSKDAELVEGVICKLTTSEVKKIVLYDDDCQFRKVYDKNFEMKYEKLCGYLEEMNIHCNGEFTRHYIIDSRMRNVLDKTFKLTKDKCGIYAKAINDKNILIIDDTISRGQSIREVCDIIKSTYKPKSITVLTLLSKKYTDNS